MEEILLGAGIMVIAEVYKWLFRRFADQDVAWWSLHIIVFACAIVATVALRVLPEEFLNEVVQLAGSSVLLYEMLWKRIVVPAINSQE